MDETLVRQLLEAGVHFGHQTKRWNPKMKRFIFGSRAGIYLIDLEQTAQCLKTACDFLERITSQGQMVLYVGTKKQAKPILEAEAQRAGMPFVINRWLGGTLTNFQTIKSNIDKLRTLRAQQADGFFERVSKKDAKRLTREMERLEEHVGGLVQLDRLPGCLFVIDTKREDIAVREAKRLGIPIVAVCDTNTDPDLIAYPIPGNDDAIRAIKLIVSQITESLLAGRRRLEVGAEPIAPVAASADEGSVAQDAVASPAPHADSASPARS